MRHYARPEVRSSIKTSIFYIYKKFVICVSFFFCVFFCLCWPSIFQIKYLAEKAIYKKSSDNTFFRESQKEQLLFETFFSKSHGFQLICKNSKKNQKNCLIFKHFLHLLANYSLRRKFFETKVVYFSILFKNGSLCF